MIEPGQKVRNTLSGITGYVAMRTESISGYVWLLVQPIATADDATEEPKTITGDECEWEAIDGSVPRLNEPRVPATHFKLGQRVKDRISGFQGIVVAETEHLNRCWSYDVQSEAVKKEDGGSGALEAFQSNRLELVDEGLLGKVKERRTGPGTHAPQKGF